MSKNDWSGIAAVGFAAVAAVLISSPIRAESASGIFGKMGNIMKNMATEAQDTIEKMNPVVIGDIEVSHAYAREMLPGQDNSAAFMTMHNKGDNNVALIGAKSENFGRIELHTHVKDGEVMRMQEVEKIEIPANGSTELKPGGLHVMLLDARRVVKEGDIVTITLFFSDETHEAVRLPVTRIQAQHQMAH